MIPISKPFIGEEEKRAVMEVLDSGMLAQGPRTAAFEEAFAKVVGTKHAIATSSGTTALHLALLGHGVGPGDEVITTAFTFIASVNSILYTGATPIFADIEEATFNIDPDAIEKAITPRTKAIMPVHLYGRPCNMARIMEIAKKHGLAVIEDSAQAIGATLDGRAAGSFGTGAFSLYATKNVMSGEGGMITTNDDGVAERCKILRTHGSKRRYYHDVLGFNFRMTDINAAIGMVQLGRLSDITAKRRANAEALTAGIKRVKTPAPFSGHAWHQYTVRLEGSSASDRDAAVDKLTKAGVGCGVFYPIPAHKQEHLKDVKSAHVSLPVAERLSAEVFSLPVHPGLSSSDVDTIVKAVNAL